MQDLPKRPVRGIGAAGFLCVFVSQANRLANLAPKGRFALPYIVQREDRHQIRIGELAQIAGCRAFLHAQHDEAMLQVQRIADQRGVIFGAAVIRLLIGCRQQRDDARPAFDALLHPRHEAGMAEILVLQPGGEARLADDCGNRLGEALSAPAREMK